LLKTFKRVSLAIFILNNPNNLHVKVSKILYNNSNIARNISNLTKINQFLLIIVSVNHLKNNGSKELKAQAIIKSSKNKINCFL